LLAQERKSFLLLRQMADKTKIFIFLPTLNIGGCEKQVFYLARELSRRGYPITLGTFYAGGLFWDKLKEENLRLICLGKKGKFDIFNFLSRVKHFIKEEQFDVIQTFLPVTDFYGIYAGHFAGISSLFSGIRCSNINFFNYSLGRKCYFLLSKFVLNKYCKVVIYNSFSGKQYHEKVGFRVKGEVIWNGIDFTETERIKNALDRDKKRSELGISSPAKVVSVIARLDPMKDHRALLRAFHSLVCQHDNLCLLIVGDGNGLVKNRLNSDIIRLKLEKYIKVLGPRSDADEIIAISDALVSSSLFGEGLSNAVIEAMTLGTPVVSTLVGDHGVVLDQGRGLLVRPRDISSLAGSLEKVLFDNGLKSKITSNACNFARKNFDLTKMVNSYLRVWGVDNHEFAPKL